MFFKFARETLFPSPSPHLVRNPDVHILNRALAPSPDSAISIPMTLWKYLVHTATIDSSTALCVGGHVYRIAEHFSAVTSVQFEAKYASYTTLHENCLVRAGFIYSGPLLWRYLKDHTIPLPSDQLPPLMPFADSYLLAGDVPQYSANPPLIPPSRPHSRAMRDRPPSSSAVADSDDSEDESEVMPILGRIESKLDQVILTQATHTVRIDHLEQNFERANYPWYDFAYRSHMVSDSMPTPSWYPRHDNFNEISFSHGFDRLRVGRRRFNNFTPPTTQGPLGDDDEMDGGVMREVMVVRIMEVMVDLSEMRDSFLVQLPQHRGRFWFGLGGVGNVSHYLLMLLLLVVISCLCVGWLLFR